MSEDPDYKTKYIVSEELKKERDDNDDRYAPIIIKTIVYTLLSLAFLALASWFFTSLITHKPI